MPLYEYKCAACGKVHERQLRIADMEAGFQVWCDCGGACKKIMSLPASVYPGADQWRRLTSGEPYCPNIPPEVPAEYRT